MPKYLTKSSIRGLRKKPIPPGQEIDLSEDEAADLIEVGALTPIGQSDGQAPSKKKKKGSGGGKKTEPGKSPEGKQPDGGGKNNPSGESGSAGKQDAGK